MREMKDASTDIIVVSNELLCKEEMAKNFDKHLSRGCNIIEVTSLQPISIMQRIVYALLEKNSFVARDADHIVFTLLSEYSRGAATIVHMLTSLMQNSKNNSRTSFELAKQQLKLHIAHLKVEKISSFSASQLPTTVKPSKEHLTAAPKHPLYMYVNDILTYNISVAAHHILNSLVITGPIPLPLFYVEELDNVVMNALSSKRVQAESPMKQLVKAGIIRSSLYPIVYHKNLNPDYIDTTVQPMFIPKLICDAVKDQMDDTDKALYLSSAVRAIENLLIAEESLINLPSRLPSILILCCQLYDVCSGELYKCNDELSDQLLTTSLKLKLRVSNMI